MRAKILLFGILFPIISIVLLGLMTYFTIHGEQSLNYRIEGYNISNDFSEHFQDELQSDRQWFHQAVSAPDFNRALSENASVEPLLLLNAVPGEPGKLKAIWGTQNFSKVPQDALSTVPLGNNQVLFKVHGTYDISFFWGQELAPGRFLARRMKTLSQFGNDRPLWELQLIDAQSRTLFSQNSALNEFQAWVTGPGASRLQTVQKSGAVNFEAIIENQPFSISMIAMPKAQLVWVSLFNMKMLLRAFSLTAYRGLLGSLSFICVIIFIVRLYTDRLTANLQELIAGVRRVGAGDLATSVKVKSRDEIGVLGNFLNQTMERLKFLLAEQKEKYLLEKELTTAQYVQETFFKSPDFSENGFELSAYIKTAGMCGGDWWHYYQVKDKVIVMLGDATGHGISAALVTSVARSATVWVEQNQVTNPSEVLSHLNEAICFSTKGQVQMTFAIFVLDLGTGAINFGNASHILPVIIPKAAARVSEMVFVDVPSGTRLGEKSGSRYESTPSRLEKGDRVVLYTDGVTDLHDKRGRAFGEKKWLSSLNAQNRPEVSSKAMKEHTAALLTKHYEGTTPIDDISYVIARRL